jgi:hypothetical protein
VKNLTVAQARRWCASQGVSLDSRSRPAAPARVSTFRVPEDAGKRVALVNGDMRMFRRSGSVLFWVTEWSVWPSAERPHIFERFRASYGVTSPLNEIPAHQFGSAEHEDLVSFVTLGVLFLWDVFVVSPRGRPMVHYSHDEHGWTSA